MKGVAQLKKTLCLLLSLFMVTSTLVFTQAATTETSTVLYSFDAVYDSASPVESAFNTNFAVEQIHTEGTGSTWMNFTIPTGQASNIGGMLFVNFTTARDYSAYDTFKLDIYTPATMNGAGGMLQFNFMSDPAMQDGYNYNIDINHLTAGWNTVTFKKANYAAHANGASWSSIRRYRITWFNYSQITNVPFMCLDNLRGIVTTHTCTTASSYKSDGTSHWTTCTECGEVMTQGSHSGGTATCTAAAVCSTCGASYGSKNASNHTGGTEVKNAKAATCGATGYTGDTYCKGCGVKTATGTTIAATGNHSGGTATCIAKAKCSTCGTSYGNLNASNHTGGTEVRNAKAATCGAAGYTGDTYCKGCGAKTATGTTIAATGNHTGGTATCTGQKLCTVCGIAYGSTNGSNHTGGTEVRNAKAATCGAAGYTGDTYCKGCGAIIASGTTIAATGNHTGGTATCNAAAVCSTCGLAYGSVNASNHVGGTELRNESATYTGDTYCLGCSTVLTKGFVIDGSGVIHSFDAVYDSSCPVSSAFNTAVAIESNAKTEGTGSTRLGFNIPVGQDSGIGGMIFIDFATAKDLTAYQQFKLDIYTPLAMEGLGGKLQVNFVTGSTMQDGYNYLLNIANINTGWNTLTFDKNSYSAYANNASWSNINRIRITWFNEAQISREFVLLDNLRGSYAAHQHTAAGSIQYDETYHWYNCSTVGCGNLVNKGVHSGGTATCTAKAICSTCGYSYGSVNSSNHAGGTEVRGATTAGCGSAGYTGDTYCLGCGVKIKTGTTISATSEHTGGTATCVAAAKCTVCGNSYGSVNSSNHVNTEVRNASATYSGDTWCKDCNTKLETGTSLIAATAHAPYAVGRDLMINNAESLDGWSPDMFNTSLNKGSEIAQGSGSVIFNANVPVGQSSNIGAMTKVSFPAVDLSSYGTIRYKIHFSHALTGTHQFQTNLITGDGGDGYNHVFTFTDFVAGWHTFEFKISDFSAAAAADLKSINAIRFTWFNLPQMNTQVTFTIDEVMALAPIGHAPYKVGNDLMINNADSTDGWIPDMFNTKIVAGAYKTEGNGSVSMNSTIPVGQSSSIGAMTKVVFPATDLSSYDKIRFKMHVSHKLTNAHQIQINFITGDGGDGYNHIITVADLAAGWHTVTIDRASIPQAVAANWSSINAIRFTWFNSEQISDKVEFIFDEIMAFVESDHSHTPTGSIKYDATNHWYDCAVIGCGNLVNLAPHSGGTATCVAAAVCSTCGYSYGSVNSSNHTGGTEVRNASSTYTGDTYCLGCSAKISTGYSIGGSGVIFPFDEVYNSNYPVTSAFNANVAIESSAKTEGTGSTRLGFSNPTGQTGGIGGMLFIDFATAKDLTAYQQFKIDVYTPLSMQGVGGFLQINFVSDSALQDGYNYNVSISNIVTGWNTLTFDKNSFVTHANSADWASIKRIRITWYNEAQISRDFLLLDNLSGVYSEHEHTATGSIQYDESYHWYNCATIGCGNLVNKGAHSGGTATCNAKAICSTCGYSYGSVNSSNHTGGTEVRDASATYTGDTYCLGCGVKIATGSAIGSTPAATGHTPYAVGKNLMINNADSLDGWESFFNATLSTGTQIDEGSGSVTATTTIPVGQEANVGAMARISFPATDFSSYESISYRLYLSQDLTGTHQLQTNLISGDGGDGYNFTYTFANLAAGWHTLTFKIADFQLVVPTDLTAIHAIRFTWFNSSQVNITPSFTFDKIMALSAGAHAPYMVGSDLMINNADATNGWIPDMFNTKIVAGAYKTEGNGSVSVNSTVPVGQDSNIGAMTKVVFPAANLTAFAKIRLQMHVSHPLNGTHQLQFNFITGDGGDGYNYVMTVADLAAGWHTITIDKASIAKAAEADWASINAIRFTWFNAQQISDKVEFIFDEIMALTGGAHTPYAVGENLMINNADSTEGWEGFFHSTITAGTEIAEGTGSVTMNCTYPYGQDQSIGSMAKVTFPATDLSSYKTVIYKFYISDDLTGVHQFQTNFITGDGGDGFNYTYTFRDMEAGWHSMTIDLESTYHAIPTATWSSINAIRFTWFNVEPISTAVNFTFDEIMAYKNEHECVAGPYIHYDEENHWYDCTAEGCAILVNKEAHFGGEATCISKAYCAKCVLVSYGEIDPNNHVNTELQNASESYTGDLYCHDCETVVKQGQAITGKEATATISTVKGAYKTGDKIAIPITITNWSKSYAYITVSMPTFDTSVLQFDGFEASETGFQGAYTDSGTNGFVLIAVPANSTAASKIRGGEVCVMYFTALKNIRTPVTISAVVKANGYAYGAEDTWNVDRPLYVVTVNGGIQVSESFVDKDGPTASISSVSNNVANNQTVNVAATDESGIAGYYFGTSATYTNNTYVANTATSFGVNVTAAGTYYITIVDTLGNVSETLSVTFNMIALNANGGSVSVQNVLVKNGNTIMLPTATWSGKTSLGWSTDVNADTGVTSIVANGNATYYAIWKDETKPVGSLSASNNALATSQTVTITMSDDFAVAGYYFGTSATYTENPYVATTAASATRTISAAGTYYLTVVDKAGNVSNTVSITFYMTILVVGDGVTRNIRAITVSGATIVPPDVTRDGYTFKGWANSADATEGNITSVVANGNATYYAIWESRDYGNFDGNTTVNEVDALNVLQASIGKTQLTEEQKKLCDVDGNGVVDNVDALYILQYAVGRITSFPVQR